MVGEGGPLIDDSQREKVSKLVEYALDKVAEALVGAEKREGVAYFYRPTILNDVSPNSNLLKEEIVGPVARAGTKALTNTSKLSALR